MSVSKKIFSAVLFLSAAAPLCSAQPPEPDTAIIAGPRIGQPAATKPAAPRKQRAWNIRRTAVRNVSGREVVPENGARGLLMI